MKIQSATPNIDNLIANIAKYDKNTAIRAKSMALSGGHGRLKTLLYNADTSPREFIAEALEADHLIDFEFK